MMGTSTVVAVHIVVRTEGDGVIEAITDTTSTITSNIVALAKNGLLMIHHAMQKPK